MNEHSKNFWPLPERAAPVRSPAEPWVRTEHCSDAADSDAVSQAGRLRWPAAAAVAVPPLLTECTDSESS